MKNIELLVAKSLGISRHRLLCYASPEYSYLDVYICFNPLRLYRPVKSRRMRRMIEVVIHQLLKYNLQTCFIFYKFNGPYDISEDASDEMHAIMI